MCSAARLYSSSLSSSLSPYPETVITTHLNADFDALASAMAASLLYPSSIIVLPGSMEKELRLFVKSSDAPSMPLARLKDIEFADIKTLVIVDTSLPNRTGVFAELITGPAPPEIHLYDHHVNFDEGAIRAASRHITKTGANSTAMTGLLREKEIFINREQATFLALGIYEDTGSFTYNSTTPEDLRAAAWLLEQGADTEVISRVIGHRFSPEHIALLNDLLNTAATYRFGATEITVAKTSTPGYVEDFSVLAHELMDMKTVSTLFTIVLMEGQTLIVARSRNPNVDTGEILKELGGGGHQSAAAASLKGVTLQEAEEKLLAVLRRSFEREIRCGQIMTSPAITVRDNAPIYEVHDLFARYAVSEMPVVSERNEIQGLINRAIVEKAVFHGIAAQKVREYMTTDFHTISPEDGLDRLKEIIIDYRQRFVPVVRENRVEGVITRTDLLEVMEHDPLKRPESLLPGNTHRRNLVPLMKERLPSEVMLFLRDAGKVAEELGFEIYVVGGFVRDLLMRRPNLDIDLVVEGDGILYARSLAARYGGRARVHEKFQTAIVILPDKRKIDVATARHEYYKYPAAMPTVTTSCIKLDLFRRDFTINTMAVNLGPSAFGTLVDFFGGQRDIRDRVIRVLHSLSFVEDPTRLFRAVRFEQRFSFKLGRHTLNLVKNSINLDMLSRLDGKRLLNELKLILMEKDPRPILVRLKELGLSDTIHPELLDNRGLRILGRVYDVLAWYRLLYRRPHPVTWRIYLMAMLWPLEPQDMEKVFCRLELLAKERAFFEKLIKRGKDLLVQLNSSKDMADSEVYRLLVDCETDALLCLMACSGNGYAKQFISRFISELQDVKPEVSGKDLKDMGYRPSPQFHVMLNRILYARLDGEVHTKEEEKRLVKKEFPLAR